jgi:glycosyltransferase involved in cell wall biosynthesis
MTDSLPPLYFDCRYIRIGYHDGISRFSAELFAEVSKLIPTVAIISDVRQLESLPAGAEHVMMNAPTSVLEPLAALKLNELGAKLVYSPMQTIGSFGKKFKLLLTVHDVIYYRFPKAPANLPLGVRLLWRLYHMSYIPQRLVLSGCDALITVSETTKAEIERAELTRNPVWVVSNAADPSAKPKRGLNNADSRDLVYMGSFMEYKNVSTLMRALTMLPEHRIHLLSKISDAEREDLLDYAGEAGDRVIFHDGVTDEEYIDILTNAQALVTASLDEGFGIPLVEAMSRGIPVVVSNTKIFNEVAGTAGLYFEATKASSLAWQVAALSYRDAWAQASKRGIEEAKRYSWQKSAQALVEAIKDLY